MSLKCSFPQFGFSELWLTADLEGPWGSDSFAGSAWEVISFFKV